MKKLLNFIVSVLVFIGCLAVGLWVARHKPLWNDEFFTQISSVYPISYANQFLGHIPEGANAPLFYFLQKLFLQLIHYQTPYLWTDSYCYSDPYSQIILRINSIVFMSLSVGVVFYYFCRRYSWGAGFLSLLIYFTSFMFLNFLAEARPYALLVFLTSLQSVVLLRRIEQNQPGSENRLWIAMAGTNILLSFTSILCAGQIIAASIIWWAVKERDWKKYILMTLMPLGIILFYYLHAIKYQFYFDLSPVQLICDNISKQRFQILFIFLFFLLVYGAQQKIRAIKVEIGEEIKKPLAYVIFMSLVLASSASVLLMLFLHAKGQGQGFAVASRYFIYLTPIGVIMTTIVCVSLFRSLSKYRILQGIFVVVFILLLIKSYY